MADLTPEQIALGLRAARAGWMWARGDVACNVWHATGERPYATRPAIVVTPYRDQLRVVSWGDDAIHHGDYATEAEAVVAALEATR